MYIRMSIHICGRTDRCKYLIKYEINLFAHLFKLLLNCILQRNFRTRVILEKLTRNRNYVDDYYAGRFCGGFIEPPSPHCFKLFF